MLVVLDTNFLLTCVKQKIDLFAQLAELCPGYKIILLPQVFGELLNLSKSKKAEGEAAAVALQILEKKGISPEKSKEIKAKSADAALLSFDAPKNVIATLDRQLRAKFKSASFLTIKGKKRIAFL